MQIDGNYYVDVQFLRKTLKINRDYRNTTTIDVGGMVLSICIYIYTQKNSCQIV